MNRWKILPSAIGVRSWLILMAAVVAAVVMFFAARFVESQNDAAHRRNEENAVRDSLQLLQSRLEGNVRSSILLARGLVSVIAANPRLTQAEFEQAAHPLFEGQSQLRAIAAAPGMVVRLMYPLAGNERALGLDYRKTPGQREAAERARETGELILAGPVQLVQGGSGLVGRIPVFLGGPGERHFWGLVSAMIDIERLYRDSGLLDEDLRIEVGLRGRDARGGFGEVFHGDPALFADRAVRMTVALPSGSWQIAARPRGGWSEKSDNTNEIRARFGIAGLLIVGPLLLLAATERQRRRAEARLRQTLADLERARADAEAGSRAKSEFLAIMSHEIRTPMNGVLGMADLLMMTRLDDEQKGFVATLQSSGRTLLSVINDILDFSKMEAGQFSLESVEIDLATLCTEACDLLRPQAMEKGVTLALDCPADLPGCLRGDGHRLRQILFNLVGNAVKFTPAGRVDVEVAWQPQAAGHALVRLSVRDTGIGIAPDVQARLFQPFSQGDASMTRRFGGTGLGLVIAQRLVRAMGGEIGFVSTPGAGTCFWIELSLPVCAVPPRAPAPPAIDAAWSGRLRGRVLVAEDNPVNMHMVRLMLARFGLESDGAENGRMAIARCAGTHYDLVLMDIQMPEMDGIEATRLLRAREAQGGAAMMPVVALTANVQAEDRQRCIDAGMNDFIAKPFRPRDLAAVLRRWLPEKVGAGGTAAESAAVPAGAMAAGASQDLPVLETTALDDLLQATGMAREDVVKMLSDDVWRLAAELEAAAAGVGSTGAAPSETARRLAHTLKSSAAQLGARRLAAVARDLEYAARDGRSADHAALLPVLRVALTELRTALGMAD